MNSHRDPVNLDGKRSLVIDFLVICLLHPGTALHLGYTSLNFC